MPNDIDLEHSLDAALAQHEAGHLDAAEAGYRTVLQHDPDHPDALNLLGLILQQRGDLQGSMTLLSRALELDPDFPEALTNLARVQRFTQQPGKAVVAAGRAVELDPDLAEAHLQLGHSRLDLGDPAGAATALRQAATLAPQSADAWLQLGIALLRLDDDQAATEALTEAHRLRPERADSIVNLGVALMGLGRLDEARSWHEKAVALAPDDAVAHAALAVTCSRCQDPLASMAACRRALALTPDRADLWLLLGVSLSATGQFAEAEACAREALRLDPDSLDARLRLVMIGQQADGAQAADIERFDGILHDPSARLTDRLSAGRALSTILERNAQYDAAFAANQFAKQLAHAHLIAEGKGFDAEALRQSVDCVISMFQRETFIETAGWGDPSDQPVFIVGMPRSGTTLVEQIAASHSAVAGIGERKEIVGIVGALNGGAADTDPSRWIPDAVRDAARGHIERLQALGGAAQRIIDKMPDNCLVLGQIAILFPNARIIVCRRDLRDVCVSCYFQQFADTINWTFDQVDLALRAQEVERLMAHWRAVLPLRMLDVQYEDLVADQEGQSRRLIEFLGLDWDPACLAFHETERPVVTASFWQVRQPMFATSIGRWRHYKQHLQPLLAGLAGAVPPEGEEDWDALAADPTTALTLAAAHHRAGRTQFAEPIYQALLRRNPDDVAALHLLGVLLTDRGEPNEGVTLIGRSLTLRPDVAPALVDLSRAHRAAGDADAAIAAARRAIALDPDLPGGLIQLGCALTVRHDDAEAVEVLRQAVALAPQALEAQFALGTALARRKDFPAAVEAWQAALALQPGNPEILLNLAQTLGDLERFDEAMETYRQADELAPGHPMIQYGIASVMVRTGNGIGAAELCRRALGTRPDITILWLLLGHCESTLGHFEAATDAYRKALELDPGSVQALNGLSAVGHGLQDDSTRNSARTVLDDVSRPVRDRITAGFALGSECDRTGNYDAAFAAYAAANGMLRADRAMHGSAFDRDHFRRLVDSLIGRDWPEIFRRTTGWGDASGLPVFVVGMPRSGTTLVEQIAASHPQVFGAGELKDVFAILTALAGEQTACPPDAWDRIAVRRETMAHIQRLRGLSEGATRVIDKLPDNIMCLGQIAVLFPQARIVVCRRDLRDLGLSCFFQYFREDTMVWADDLADVGFRTAQVERLMDHWRKVLPVPILEIQYETLVANLERESRRLIDFLGLDWDPACLAFHETERTVLTASHWQVRQPLYASSVGRWRHYRKHLEPLLQELRAVTPADQP